MSNTPLPNKVNYQKKLEETLKEIAKKEEKPSLLLHSCCAPCSTYVLEYLAEKFKLTISYYNPNISPSEEYFLRAKELGHLIEEMQLSSRIDLRIAAFDNMPFFELAKGKETEPEGGSRCVDCYRLRLAHTAALAKELQVDYFTTSLSISPHKNATLLNEIGEEQGGIFGIQYLYSDFKKKGGYLRSCELSKQYGLYRQEYCGCIFSKNNGQSR
ncbi:MAG: epoxyqueuosine reductase QueH [Bacillota bacterium]